MSLCYCPGDRCITASDSSFWLHYSTVMFARRDVRYLYPGDYICFDCVPVQSALLPADVGERCASRVWVEVVIYMLSAMGLNFSDTERAHAEIALTGKWLMVSIWNDCPINCGVDAVKWYSIAFVFSFTLKTSQFLCCNGQAPIKSGSFIKKPTPYPSESWSKEISVNNSCAMYLIWIFLQKVNYKRDILGCF